MAAYRSSQGSAELCLLVTATGPKGTNMELHQGRLGVRRRFCTRGQQAGSKLAELKELLDSALRHQFLDSCGARSLTQCSLWVFSHLGYSMIMCPVECLLGYCNK